MATYTVKDIIGKDLIALQNVVCFYKYPMSKEIFTVPKGQSIGKVDTYLDQTTPNGELWWGFIQNDPYGVKRPYYVKHDKDKMTIGVADKARVQSQEEIAEKIVKDKKIEDDGAVIYYLEKYGKPAAAIVALVALVKALK
jgi:hypothetical protein